MSPCRCHDPLSTQPSALVSIRSTPDRFELPAIIRSRLLVSSTDTVEGVVATRIVLVRHGESLAQERRIVGGHRGCEGLSDLGRRQAQALRNRLAQTGELAGAAALYASIMPRAIETASIISPAIGSLEVVRDCDFCEIHPGEGDGLSWDEYDGAGRLHCVGSGSVSRPGWRDVQRDGGARGSRARHDHRAPSG